MPSTRGPDHSQIRVLVVSDLGLGARTLQRLEEARPVGLRLVGNSASLEEAERLISTTRPRVIVIDIDGEYGPDTIADLATCPDAFLLAVTRSGDLDWQDGAVLAGAHGVVQKHEAAEVLVSAIRCVHEGKLWISHAAADRILAELAQARAAARSPERISEKLARFTAEERIIAAEITRGHPATPREIAARLKISEPTLRDQLASMYRKLELAEEQGDSRRTRSGPTAALGRRTRGDGRDPIVLLSGQDHPAPVRSSRWKRLRRST